MPKDINLSQKDVSNVKIKIIQLYYILEQGVIFKDVIPFFCARVCYFKWEPIKTKSIIPNIQKVFFCLFFISKFHSSGA